MKKKLFPNSIFLLFTIAFFSCSTMQSTITVPQNWPMVKVNETAIRKSFELRNFNIDQIEGVWEAYDGGVWKNLRSGQRGVLPELNDYRIAIFRDSLSTYDYTAVILESRIEPWKAGMVKAYFRRTAYDNMYDGIWFLLDFGSERGSYIIESNGIMKCNLTKLEDNFEYNYESRYVKAYPPFSNNNEKSSNNEVTTGTGFLVSQSGLIVTNHHVIKNGNNIDILFPELNIKKKASIKIKDVKNDIAILEIHNFVFRDISEDNIPFPISEDNSVKLGEEVFTLGFPLGDILGAKSKLSTGRINSLFGLQDDPSIYQISNPVQPGNSGGPLFNNKGELIGVVVSSLNSKYFYEKVGIIPQNVNFAIKSSYLRNIISLLPDGDEILKRKNHVLQSNLENQIEQINKFVVQIIAK